VRNLIIPILGGDFMGLDTESILEWVRPFKNIGEMIDDIKSKRYFSAFKNYLQSVPGVLALKPVIGTALKLGVQTAIKHGVSATVASKIGLSVGKIAAYGIKAYTAPGVALGKLGAKTTTSIVKAGARYAVTNPWTIATAGLYTATAIAAQQQYKRIKSFSTNVKETSERTGMSPIKVAFHQLKRTLSS